MHTLLDLRGNIPTFIHISDGKMQTSTCSISCLWKPEAFYVMDRGYLDYARLYGIHQTGAFFVTRAKRGMEAGASTRRRPTGPWHHLRSDHHA